LLTELIAAGIFGFAGNDRQTHTHTLLFVGSGGDGYRLWWGPSSSPIPCDDVSDGDYGWVHVSVVVCGPAGIGVFVWKVGQGTIV
jgi:hypothetical protein